MVWMMRSLAATPIEVSEGRGHVGDQPDSFRGWLRPAPLDGRIVSAVAERRHPVDGVAESIGKGLVGTAHEAIDREIGVADRRDVARDPPAQRVAAEVVGQFGWRQPTHRRLGELGATDGQVGVDLDASRRRFARRQQERRPVHGVEPGNALTDHVNAFIGAGPPVAVELAGGAVVEGTEVVDEGVEPDVDDLRRVIGDRDAPAAGPVDRS